ncbi:hypothetical protein LSAT2_016464 [Lamellibrachia satsuma]|nr:hypothetical protein LSAT2_016464 [Lamellibrachia satsuma]
MPGLGDFVSAYKAKRTLGEIKRAKINVERERLGLPPIRSWSENMWMSFCMSARAAVLQTCCGCFLPDERGQRPGILSSGTLPNEIMKSVFGFVCGLTLSILMFLMLVYQLQYSPGAAFAASAIVSSTFSIGLAFSTNVRCIVMIAVPTLFSGKGRAVLLMYAFVLITSYPMENFQHNTRVMSQSSLCGQEAAYNATKEVVDVALAPVRSIIGRIRKLIKSLMRFTNVLKQGFRRVQRVFEEILAAVSRVKAWLLSFVQQCNDKMGTPFRKCRGAITNAVERCKRKAWIFKFACNIAKVYWVCHIARVGELLCLVTDAIVKIFIERITPRLQMAVRNVVGMFDFGVDLDYHYSLQLNQSKTFEDIREDIDAEVAERLAFVETLKTWSNLLLLWTIGYVLLKATLYRFKYLTRDYFDNVYITHTVELIDERRQELGKETILPLTWHESRKYVFVCKYSAVRVERDSQVRICLLEFSRSRDTRVASVCKYSVDTFGKVCHRLTAYDVGAAAITAVV